MFMHTQQLVHVDHDDSSLMDCTKVQSVDELFASLEGLTMWKELGEQLKVSQTRLYQIQNDSMDVKEKVKNLVRLVHILD